MKRQTLLILLLVVGLGLLGCRWVATPVRLILKPTPTPAAPPTASPTEVSPPIVLDTGAGGVTQEEALLTNLYEQLSPSVVHIRVTQKVTQDTPSPFPELPGLPGLPQMPDEFYRRGEGSGFVWDREGHIVTNYHVVEGATIVQVHFFDDTVAEAEVIGLDSQSDIAVIRVDPSATQLRPVTLGDSDAVKVGQLAIAIGNPFGQTWTMTRGIISALGRTIRSGSSPFAIPEMIQTDAAINQGNSGGPLLDSGGRVIGVNTMIISPSGVSAGVGFAVPVNIVKQVVPELIDTGRYAYPWLGIRGRDLLPEDVETMDLAIRQGVLIINVTQDSPADKADLRGSDRTVMIDGEQTETGGDVIISVEGQSVRGMDDLIAYLVRHTRPGQKVTMRVIREGKEVSVTVILGQRPDELNR